jgi:hypothetical protein
MCSAIADRDLAVRSGPVFRHFAKTKDQTKRQGSPPSGYGTDSYRHGVATATAVLTVAHRRAVESVIRAKRPSNS